MTRASIARRSRRQHRWAHLASPGCGRTVAATRPDSVRSRGSHLDDAHAAYHGHPNPYLHIPAAHRVQRGAHHHCVVRAAATFAPCAVCAPLRRQPRSLDPIAATALTSSPPWTTDFLPGLQASRSRFRQPRPRTRTHVSQSALLPDRTASLLSHFISGAHAALEFVAAAAACGPPGLGAGEQHPARERASCRGALRYSGRNREWGVALLLGRHGTTLITAPLARSMRRLSLSSASPLRTTADAL